MIYYSPEDGPTLFHLTGDVVLEESFSGNVSNGTGFTIKGFLFAVSLYFFFLSFFKQTLQRFVN
jgi:hypothetical protein